MKKNAPSHQGPPQSQHSEILHTDTNFFFSVFICAVHYSSRHWAVKVTILLWKIEIERFSQYDRLLEDHLPEVSPLLTVWFSLPGSATCSFLNYQCKNSPWLWGKHVGSSVVCNDLIPGESVTMRPKLRSIMIPISDPQHLSCLSL